MLDIYVNLFQFRKKAKSDEKEEESKIYIHVRNYNNLLNFVL